MFIFVLDKNVIPADEENESASGIIVFFLVCLGIEVGVIKESTNTHNVIN